MEWTRRRRSRPSYDTHATDQPTTTPTRRPNRAAATGRMGNRGDRNNSRAAQPHRRNRGDRGDDRETTLTPSLFFLSLLFPRGATPKTYEQARLLKRSADLLASLKKPIYKKRKPLKCERHPPTRLQRSQRLLSASQN